MESSKVNLSTVAINETQITSNQSNPVENKIIPAKYGNTLSVAKNSNVKRFVEILNTKDVVRIIVEFIMKPNNKQPNQNKIRKI